jgi:lysophospholipase L1-like esterase
MSTTLDVVTDLADGLHPNAVGYQKMFELISTKLN